MALLKVEDGRIFDCDRNTFVGRGLIDGVSFDEPDGLDLEVSSMHASITWNPKTCVWELRDLGSHNGTYVGGRRLDPGVVSVLQEGTSIVFGRLHLEFLEASPPTANALCQRTGEVVVAESGALVLPDERNPEVIITQTEDGWYRTDGALSDAETSNPKGAAPIGGALSIDAGGRTWEVRVPPPYQRTAWAERQLIDFTLVVELREADKFGLILERDNDVISLPSRAHGELLWLLARARLKDLEADVSEKKRGWLSQEEIIRQMRPAAKDPVSYLNVLAFRARRQIEPHIPSEFMDVIERDPDRPGFMRIGTPRLRIDG